MEKVHPAYKEFLWPQLQGDGSVRFIIPDADVKKLPSHLRKEARTLSVVKKVRERSK